MVQGSGGDAWVTEVKIETSVDDVSWISAIDTAEANQERNAYVNIYIPTVTQARYVRITVLAFYLWPSMRAGVLQNAGQCRSFTPTRPSN